MAFIFASPSVPRASLLRKGAAFGEGVGQWRLTLKELTAARCLLNASPQLGSRPFLERRSQWTVVLAEDFQAGEPIL